MGIPCYLAMTAAEMLENPAIPAKTAWMACHFSPYGTGLSNLPSSLPAGSVLTLNDATPVHGHDPQRVFRELEVCAERLQCRAVLLDFQRRGNPETEAVVAALGRLSCPLVVSEAYAQGDCGVFLPPVPPSVPLAEYLAPWQGREIWMELALDGESITLTQQGSNVLPLPYPDPAQLGFGEETLHCHYHVRLKDDAAEFTLWRTWEDLVGLLAEAERLDVAGAVGLYQELNGCQNVW